MLDFAPVPAVISQESATSQAGRATSARGSLRRFHLTPIPPGWAPASEHDSRGPGAYSDCCNTWHPADATVCRICGTPRRPEIA